MTDAFAPLMRQVAEHFRGEPNARLSSRDELRWGAQGSFSVDLKSGTFFDHEAKEGGGVLQLVEREAKVQNGARLDYLREQVGVDLPDERPTRETPARIVQTYDYTDEGGSLIFQVCRMEPKGFRQRRPDGKGGWNWSVKGVRQVPYRLLDMLDAIHAKMPVYVVEGEKDADALWALGVPATCNAGGSSKWPDELCAFFSGAEVVIVPDNDDPGRNHANLVGANLSEVASVRVLELPGLPPKGDVSDWLAAGGSKQALETLAADAPAWRPAPPQSRYGAILWSDLRNVRARTDWSVRGLLFPRDMGLIYGESRAGKSFLAADLGLAIAQGSRFFDMECRQGPVVYQIGEGQDGFLQRLQAYGAHHGVADADLPFLPLKARVNLHSDDPAPFIDELRQWRGYFGGLSAVFVDTFSAATPGANENASEDVSRVLNTAHEIRTATGAAVIFVHHKNAGGQKARGHTSLFADADMALDVERGVDTDGDETDDRWFTIRKVKDGEDGRKLGFRLQSVTIGSEDDGKPIRSCVIDPAQDAIERTGQRKALAPGQAKFLTVLDAAIIDRGGVLPPGDRLPINMLGVEWGAFRDLYRRMESPDKADGAIRQALTRDGDALLARGIIGRDDPWIWISDKGRLWCR